MKREDIKKLLYHQKWPESADRKQWKIIKHTFIGIFYDDSELFDIDETIDDVEPTQWFAEAMGTWHDSEYTEYKRCRCDWYDLCDDVRDGDKNNDDKYVCRL